MSLTPLIYPDWKTPAHDRGLLIWPDAEDLLRHTIENQQRLNSAQGVRVQGVPLPELRRRMRRWVGHADDQRPLIVTGHQTELYHPGVWIKNVLINAIARRLDGQAYHLGVDTDEPKHLRLHWPGGGEPLTDDEHVASTAWAGLVEAPTPRHLMYLEQAVQSASGGWRFEPLLPQFLAAMKRLSLDSPNLPAALVNAVHELEWDLGLRHHALLVSPMWLAEPYLAFAHHLLADAPAFTAAYNTALRNYRKVHRIRKPARPMPDLAVSEQSCEAPFWLDSLDAGIRRRAVVHRGREGWELTVPDGEAFNLRTDAEGWSAAEELARFLRANRLRLTPRAVTLTMFFRLLLADLFIHGTGGGRYDQVTDRLIGGYLKIDPPRFAVATATLYFPDAIGRQRVCLPCIRHEGHQIRHRLLGEEKMRMVERIASLPRLSSQRQEMYQQMHRCLAEAAAHHPAIRQWEQKRRQAEQRQREDEELFDRELFFALQPRDRLLALIEQVEQEFGQ